MTETKKETTVYIYLNDTNSLPFPDLDKIGSQLIPFYDFKEYVGINLKIVSFDASN